LLGFVAGLPGVLRVAWAIWLTAVAINVVVWALVSGTTGHLIYPWPLWVAGPYGAALLAISAVVAGTRAQQRIGR
jgi:NhaP-type Na+/H+ or K+/H+ antiporter